MNLEPGEPLPRRTLNTIFINPLASINLNGVDTMATRATMEGDDRFPNVPKGPTMQRPTVVTATDEIRFRRPRQWTMLAFALLLTCGIVSPGAGSQGGDTAKQKAIAALEKLGGKVFQDGIAPDKPVIGVDLDETHATDDDLAHLEVFPRLQSLSLDETQVTDVGLVHLERLTNLTDLDLDETTIGDAGLAHLKGLVNLRKLTLTHTRVTDAGLAHLKGLKRLETLSLMGTKVTDAGLVHLKGLSRLEWLFLDDNPITDAGLAELKGLQSLEFLLLNRTEVTDAGLRLLEGMTNLEMVSLHNTHVTDAGADRLQKALRKAKIYH
jgi:Leucine-rich repeat (LRR) protein